MNEAQTPGVLSTWRPREKLQKAFEKAAEVMKLSERTAKRRGPQLRLKLRESLAPEILE